jgi:hypothetical protein
VGRLLQGINHFAEERDPLLYLIRLVAYSLILVAVLDKNLRKKSRD